MLRQRQAVKQGRKECKLSEAGKKRNGLLPTIKRGGTYLYICSEFTANNIGTPLDLL